MKPSEHKKPVTAVDGHILSATEELTGDSIQGYPHRMLNIPDGRIAFDDQGVICYVGERDRYEGQTPGRVLDYRGCFLLPGFIDSHTHFPQQDMMACHSGRLLTWLEDHTFPQEVEYGLSDSDTISQRATRFIERMLNHGTTTAVIYSSSSFHVTNGLLSEINKKKMRAILGKVSMNRHAPAELLVPTNQDLDENAKLLDLVKKLPHDRIHYALTPRFAPSCTPDLMQGLAEIHKANPESYIQTHFAENLDEIKWVEDLFPASKDYLDVYDQLDLLGDRTILAHAIHTRARELSVIKDKCVSISHCPSSNLFLGSGLFPLREMVDAGVRLSLGTDVGAGTSFSLWSTLGDAYKISKVRGETIAPSQLFYLATLGAAQSLSLDHQVGSLSIGKKADIQVLDYSARADFKHRLERVEEIEQILLAMIYFTDDRCTKAVYVDGHCVSSKNSV